MKGMKGERQAQTGHGADKKRQKNDFIEPLDDVVGIFACSRAASNVGKQKKKSPSSSSCKFGGSMRTELRIIFSATKASSKQRSSTDAKFPLKIC
uniref:Uncharacterized protein n=1 Tax=Romanomermis culicivorax TaxID=13658 RepID=A0A915J9C8_ROMCU